MKKHTPTSLVDAIKALFKSNNYEIKGPIQFYGAEIDLVATPLADPFGTNIYIEATIEYVDNDKYGKDVGKLALAREHDPTAQCVIISSSGFSLPVQERANKTRIITLSYDELFIKFERFEPYIAKIGRNTDYGNELIKLNEIYEEPLFEDSIGTDNAIEYLTKWRDIKNAKQGWLIIIGEYGTGKTALTKVLQYRWLQEYITNPSFPIPFRIELREFPRQFNARGLLHHFLDNNSLSHIPVDFVLSLIKTGRIILLLDGYDEMAQYLHIKERRACLEALAELSADGAKGILTSRPNYFTESEEMQVFEVLYSSLKSGNYYIGKEGHELIEKEKKIDCLVEQFLYRFERILKDLSQEQTETLVSKVLSKDPEGRDVVLGILSRVFRSLERGETISLSGKPVIISYLLEVVEGLKNAEEAKTEPEPLSEWQIYKLIIDQLMLRDLQRSPEIAPNVRRSILHNISVFLSKKENNTIKESDFKDLIAKVFRKDLNRLPSESRHAQIERYFADLRSSSTLTRSSDENTTGWRFSHNTLREYLVAEYLLNSLGKEQIVSDNVPISDAMRMFCASRTIEEKKELLAYMSRLWRSSSSNRGMGQLMSLLWNSFLSLFTKEDEPVSRCLKEVCGDPIAILGVHLSRMTFSTEQAPVDLSGINYSGSNLTEICLNSAKLCDAKFIETTLENVAFVGAQLNNACFRNTIINDVDFTDADLQDADFTNTDKELISIYVDDKDNVNGRIKYEGIYAIGYLKYCGAVTDEVPNKAVYIHHPRFKIVDKIMTKLAVQSIRQRRGLVQRGAARNDIPFSNEFIDYLVTKKLLFTPMNRKDFVETTGDGRKLFTQYKQTNELPEVISSFLRDN